MPVEDEELESLRLESTHTIDIEKFVPRGEVDELYLDSPYYLTPEDHVGLEAFAVMKRKNVVRSQIGSSGESPTVRQVTPPSLSTIGMPRLAHVADA